MHSSRPDPLLPVVFRLFVAWWIGLWIYGWLVHGILPTAKWYAAAKTNVMAWLIGAAIGIAGMTAWVYLRRALIKHRLKGEVWRDISWSIGKFPIKPVPPAAVKRYRPDISDLNLPDSVKAAPWHEAWRERVMKLTTTGDRSEPAAYVAMMEAIWRALEFHRHVPAGVFNPSIEPPSPPRGLLRAVLYRLVDWRKLPRWLLNHERRRAADQSSSLNPHGSFTLFEHSYTTASVMLDMAKTWSFEDALAVWDSQRGTSMLEPRVKFDRDYTFDANDPLIPIIGLAHDLGKLRVFYEIEPGVWRSNRKRHDRESALCLAAIDEWWYLHYKDKRATSTVLEAYHCARELKEKLHPDAEDDRNFCLAMLLIAADKVGLKLQGSHNSTIEYEEPQETSPVTQALAPTAPSGQASSVWVMTEQQAEDAVWGATLAVFEDPSRVTRANSPRSMGQRVTAAVRRQDGRVEEMPVLICSTYALIEATWSRLPRDVKEHFGRAHKKAAFARTLMARLARSNLIVTKLADQELKGPHEEWLVNWYTDFPGNVVVRNWDVRSTILIAGGPLLHVGKMQEESAWPCKAFIRVTSTQEKPQRDDTDLDSLASDSEQPAESAEMPGPSSCAATSEEAEGSRASEAPCTVQPVAADPLPLEVAKRKAAQHALSFVYEPGAMDFAVTDSRGAVQAYKIPQQYSLDHHKLRYVYGERVFDHYKSGALGFCRPKRDATGEVFLVIDMPSLLEWHRT